jgi:hypothetical protein
VAAAKGNRRVRPERGAASGPPDARAAAPTISHTPQRDQDFAWSPHRLPSHVMRACGVSCRARALRYAAVMRRFAPATFRSRLVPPLADHGWFGDSARFVGARLSGKASRGRDLKPFFRSAPTCPRRRHEVCLTCPGDRRLRSRATPLAAPAPAPRERSRPAPPGGTQGRANWS